MNITFKCGGGKDKLKNKETFTGPALITVTRKDNQEKLWDSTDSNDKQTKSIEVKWNSSDTIEITLKSWVNGIRTADSMSQNGSFQETNLYCKNTKLGRGNGKVFYKDGELAMNTFGQRNIEKTPMTTSVSLVSYVDTESGKKQECDLKVVTWNGLDWSKKFDEKATLILEEKVKSI